MKVKKLVSVLYASVLVASMLPFASVSYAAGPATPSGLSVSCATNACNLNWSAVSGATGYNVYRSTTSGGTYTKVNASPIGTNSNSDGGLTAATTFYYKVSAVNSGGESAQSAASSGTTQVNLGPNVYVVDPSMSTASIQSTADSIYAQQETNQFGTQRYAMLFKPGNYNNLNIKVGFYTTIAGLGQNPDNVNITGGVNADAKWMNANATLNFWRSIENFAVTPTIASTSQVPVGTMQWAVSQAAPMRRVHVKGSLYLFDFDPGWNAGWGSGGYMADNVVDSWILPASQQQWFNRNNQYTEWKNGVWNMVFVGDTNPPAGTFPTQPYTVVDKTPVLREKPYLYIDNAGQYNVFVPSVQNDTKGASWASGSTPGQSISINQFYIADPATSTAASINAALSQGKNLLFTPGIYHLNDTIRVTNANTVVLGLGFATLVPDTGLAALTVADVDGVKVAGLLFEAGAVNSPVLMEVGPTGSSQNHAANPTSLYDLFFGVGGFAAGSADVALKINSNNVIGDDFWIWRADHGAGAGWTTNASKNGLIVNGANVTMYGLFNEHHEEYQTLWNGNGGRLYFYQSEIPYDVPNQAAWMSKGGTENGYPSYKVADNVSTHEAWGLGVYSFFRDAAVKLQNAIEVPDVQGVKIHHMTTVWLAGTQGSEISHVINNIGNPVTANSPTSAMVQTVSEFQGSGTGDTQAPSTPSGLTATATSSSQINLSWTASTDNVGVTGYDIYRGGTLIGSSTTTSYSDTGLTASTAYSYTVKAKDAAGNVSAASGAASATTQAGGGGGGTYTALSRTGWTATSNPTSGDAPANLLDNNMSTRWSTGATMTNGQYFVVDMKSAQSFNRVVMDSTNAANDYARGYQVFVSNDGTNWGSAVASGTGSTAVITVDFAAQSARYIKVVQTGTASSWWSINEFNVYSNGGGGGGGDTQAPSTPSGLTATATSSSQINLSWTASTDNVGVTGYDIYRGGTLVGSSTTTSYSDTGLTASTAYSYTVKAKDAAGNVSAASSAASATTQAGGGGGGTYTALSRTGWTATSNPTSGDVPANLLDGSLTTRWSTGATMANGQYFVVDMKSAQSFNRVVMDSTNAANDYARGYQVFVSNDGTNWGSAVASGTGSTAVITVDFAAQSARYIKVVQTGTASSWWSINEFNVYSNGGGGGGGDTQAPSTPSGLTATATSSSQINLSWTASTDNVGVTGYDIYRGGTLVGSSTTTSYSDTGLTASTAYSYTVKAKDAAGNVSAASSAASATTQAGGGGGTYTALSRTGWTATSNPTSGDVPANLLDGSLTTRWSTGAAMANGQYFIVDMQSAKTFRRIVMDSTNAAGDYARGYQVFVSSDGTNWGTAVASGTGSAAVITVDFSSQSARYVKVVQTGTASSWWSINEFNVYN
ncbi:discoidin domain-containing protein [Paenibacillus athensensis]|uniref:discoidin domain-containing protein n=1 Tax=Paenibacillus athensensis TaxID=1967502 RepID=UPI001E2D0027|nr:discoidin domain-containing protein [Paenibacillus athensensis]MCD1261171.1 discoidin domain-containing protein [Paenibacillus athensensis]